MRQLSLQEVEVVSGAGTGTNTTIVDFTVNDVIKWCSAYFGGMSGYAAGTGSTLASNYPLTVPFAGVNASQYALGGLGGMGGAVAGYALGHFLGQLFNSQVVTRVG